VSFPRSLSRLGGYQRRATDAASRIWQDVLALWRSDARQGSKGDVIVFPQVDAGSLKRADVEGPPPAVENRSAASPGAAAAGSRLAAITDPTRT
jgi:hypothetical protein